MSSEEASTAHWIRATQPNSQGRLRAIAAARSNGNSFVIKCDDPGQGSVYVHLIVPHDLGGDFDDRPFEYSIDGGPAVTDTWTYLKNGVCLLSRADGFLRAIRAARQFECAALTTAGTKRNYRFDIAGAGAAIEFVSQVCERQPLSDGASPAEVDSSQLTEAELSSVR